MMHVHRLRSTAIAVSAVPHLQAQMRVGETKSYDAYLHAADKHALHRQT